MKTASLLFSAALSASFFPAPAVHAQVPGFTSLVEFTGTSGSKIGYRPMATLLKASDGDFYGTTVRGGTADVGSIFKVTAGGTFTPLRSFTGAAQPTGGIYPVGGLAENSDGFLYGTTSGDYTSTPPSYGIAFKVSANGTTFSNLLFFTGNTTPNKGTQPYASLVRASDGNFYGTTQYGGTGTANYGTIFRLTPAGALTTVIEFSNNGSSNKGASPNAQLVDGGDGFLYGSTYAGGTGNFGTLFKYKVSNGAFTTLVNFTNASSPNPGKFPIGAMLLASDGYLYGTTVNGGSFNAGVVYRLNRTTGTAATIVEFSDANGTAQGAWPTGGLAQGSDGNLYGTTQNGGPNDYGTIYRLTTGGVLTARLIDFTGTSGTAKGEGPYGSLVTGNDGNLYGTTQYGGASDRGTVFKLDLSVVPLAPVVVTSAATGVTNSTATLNGTVNPNNSATTWQFEYGATTSYGTSMPIPAGSLSAGNTAQAVSISLSSLAPGSTFHYRLNATNTNGTTNGSDATFSTTGTPQAPVVVTGAASEITGTSAKLNGTVNSQGSPTTWQFEYGSDVSYGSVIPAVAGSTNAGTAEPVSTTLGSLTPGTTVFYRLKATNSVGTIYGSGGSFTTLQPPAVVTQTAIAITTTGATLTGTVNPNGSAASWQYEYGPDTNYGQVSPTLPGTTGTGNSPETVPTNLSGLTPGATLHYRLKATNGSGTVYGADMTFTTKQPPTVVTGLASSITASGAVLNATVNPRGAASTWQIEYGTTTAYGQSLPVTPGDAGNGTAAVNVNVPVTGLQPNTVYHFRVKATSTYGTSNGSDAVFTTNNNILGWRQLNFGTTANTGDAADNADPDHDGIVNLLEYGYGMNPKVRDSALLPRPTYNGNTLITSFNQPAGVNDVTYGAEVSTSLQSWSPIADSGSGGAHTFAAPFSSAGKHYMRLKVTLIP